MLRVRLLESFHRMLRFYGFEKRADTQDCTIRKADDWPMRSAVWLHPHNHNHLRITRILKSLMLLGAREEAAAFYRALNDVYASNDSSKIAPVTMQYWTRAVTDENTRAPRGL